jgi:HEPN domain-containing protein
MSNSKPLPGSSVDWLRHAHSDLASAKKDEAILYETLCFHAQQAVEKAIKAVLIFKRCDIKRTHDIGLLLELLPQEIEKPSLANELPILNDYAVSARYPGAYEEVDAKEYEFAIQLAKDTIMWAEVLVAS